MKRYLVLARKTVDVDDDTDPIDASGFPQEDVVETIRVSGCDWTQDWEGHWDTECGERFIFFDGGPDNNDFVYCPYCGDRIMEHPYSEDNANE